MRFLVERNVKTRKQPFLRHIFLHPALWGILIENQLTFSFAGKVCPHLDKTRLAHAFSDSSVRPRIFVILTRQHVWISDNMITLIFIYIFFLIVSYQQHWGWSCLTPVAFLWLAWPPSKEHSLFVPRHSSWFMQSTTPVRVFR